MKPKSFFICPVRGVDPKITEKFVKRLEKRGYIVHWPPRDTNQDDPVGLEICIQNLGAIINADVIHVNWDGKSQGCLFDLGMAFALNKKLVIVSIPKKTKGKSFQNMMRKWALISKRRKY